MLLLHCRLWFFALLGFLCLFGLCLELAGNNLEFATVIAFDDIIAVRVRWLLVEVRLLEVRHLELIVIVAGLVYNFELLTQVIRPISVNHT